VEKSTYLAILFSGQFGLLVLDVRERLLTWDADGQTGPPRVSTVLFLVVTILIYGSLQFGGLALVPGIEGLLGTARSIINDLVPWSRDGGYETVSISLLVVLVVFYFAGLCDYLLHRFASHSRLLWFTHENHHLPTDVSVYMPGLCVRPFAVLAIFPTMAVAVFSLTLVLALCGQGGVEIMPLVYLAVLLQVAIGSMSHSAFLRRCWWLHALLRPLGLTSPQEHWLHHVAGLNGNFGNFTTLWDRVLGTYLDPVEMRGKDYQAGLDYDQDFLGTLTFGKLKLSDGIRRRFQLQKFCHLQN
jgi:sterol desaturase/sphingolipid hydroxylase (fatty acid hydroxylase superfamily)